MTVEIHKGTFYSMSFGDGVFINHLDQDIKGTPEQAWEWVNCIEDIMGQLKRPFPLMTIIQHKVEFTSEARKIMRRLEDVEHLVAHAVCVETMAKKAMVRFLMVLAPRSRFQEEVFLDESECTAWLRQQIASSVHARVTSEEVAQLQIAVRTEAP